MFQPEYLKSRSQDLEKSYHDSGQFYFFCNSKGSRSKNSGQIIRAIVIDDISGHDIDTIEDWKNC